MRFADREHAGRTLADELATRTLGGADDVQLLALPRGGVPVAAPLAARFGWPLDVLVVRKVGAPGHRELAIGAVAEGGAAVRDDALCAQLGVDEDAWAHLVAEEGDELDRRIATYRGDAPLPPVADRHVVLVDDGLATGATAVVAVRDLRDRGARSLTIGVPVGARDAVHRLELEADHVVCLQTPDPFRAVGQWYRRFDQTTDAEVLDLLARHRRPGRR